VGVESNLPNLGKRIQDKRRWRLQVCISSLEEWSGSQKISNCRIKTGPWLQFLPSLLLKNLPCLTQHHHWSFNPLMLQLELSPPRYRLEGPDDIGRWTSWVILPGVDQALRLFQLNDLAVDADHFSWKQGILKLKPMPYPGFKGVVHQPGC